MLKPSVSLLVFRTLFPRPRQGDPTTFTGHVNRNLVPEVRIETAHFYGALDCIEAQYPGLDYSHPPHRRRLARFPWHNKLFRAFDELGLTRNEILSLCQWEGTRSAKEKYEKDVGRQIRDTTMDGIAPAEVVRPPAVQPTPDLLAWQAQTRQAVVDHPSPGNHAHEMGAARAEEEVDALASNYSDALNIHLRAAATARATGFGDPVADEQWEQWLKEAMERNELDVDGMLEAIRQGRPFPISPRHILDASVNPPTLSIASAAPSERPAAQTTTATAAPISSQTAASAPTRSLSTSPEINAAMNDTQIAMVNVWNLGNEIVRNVNAGNPAVVASTSATTQTAGEAR